jgi:hypothetical protein
VRRGSGEGRRGVASWEVAVEVMSLRCANRLASIGPSPPIEGHVIIALPSPFHCYTWRFTF